MCMYVWLCTCISVSNQSLLFRSVGTPGDSSTTMLTTDQDLLYSEQYKLEAKSHITVYAHAPLGIVSVYSLAQYSVSFSLVVILEYGEAHSAADEVWHWLKPVQHIGQELVELLS